MTVEQAAGTTMFSLDGVHPNNKGYVFMANTFLDVINDLTGASYAQIPLAAGVWDPTYGVPIAAPSKSGGKQWPYVSPEIAQSLKTMFR